MGKAMKTFRRSIHVFLHSYHSLASVAAFLVFPFSASLLLSQALTPSSSHLLRNTSSRMESLFRAAGFPASSQFFSLLNVKLTQTIFSFAATFAPAVTFLLLAKASVILVIGELHCRRFAHPLLRIYRFLLPTQLFNSLVILSANAAFFSIVFLVFNAADSLSLSSGHAVLVLSAAGAILYSVLLANTLVVCNIAIVVAAMESCSGHLPVFKACVLVRGREATAITLALPTTLGMAAVEALFQYRVVKPCQNAQRLSASMMGEAFSIAYMHSLLLVIDVIISYKLYESLRKRSANLFEFEPEIKINLNV